MSHFQLTRLVASADAGRVILEWGAFAAVLLFPSFRHQRSGGPDRALLGRRLLTSVKLPFSARPATTTARTRMSHPGGRRFPRPTQRCDTHSNASHSGVLACLIGRAAVRTRARLTQAFRERLGRTAGTGTDMPNDESPRFPSSVVLLPENRRPHAFIPCLPRRRRPVFLDPVCCDKNDTMGPASGAAQGLLRLGFRFSTSLIQALGRARSPLPIQIPTSLG